MKENSNTFRSRAPLRLGLAGGGTDLSPYCDIYGGAVLNVTIDRYAYASLSLTGGEKVYFRAADLDLEIALDKTAVSLDGPLPLHRAVYCRMMSQFNENRRVGLTLTTMVDAPAGSGLGSSSALVVALVDVFRAALNLPLGRYDVAHLAYEIERLDLELAGGKQDQYAAAFGGVNYIEFLAGDRVIVNPLRLPPGVLNELQSSLVICFSGQSRQSDHIIADQIANARENGDAGLEGLHHLKTLANDMKVAILRGDLDRVAKLLNESWNAKKQTSRSVSNPIIEKLWTVGHNAGAKAAKVSGAGGGGFMMFIVDPDRRAALGRALRECRGTSDVVGFSGEGVEAWQVLRSI